MNKRNLALMCFLTDLGISIWSYFKLTNYDEYIKTVKPYLASPDFQVQIYQVLLQSVTFSLVLFLSFHLVVYYLLVKNKKWALKYVRVYTLLAAVSCVLMIATQYWFAIIPMIVYFYAFSISRKIS